jgi:hypothetical protein
LQGLRRAAKAVARRLLRVLFLRFRSVPANTDRHQLLPSKLNKDL